MWVLTPALLISVPCRFLSPQLQNATQYVRVPSPSPLHQTNRPPPPPLPANIMASVWHGASEWKELPDADHPSYHSPSRARRAKSYVYSTYMLRVSHAVLWEKECLFVVLRPKGEPCELSYMPILVLTFVSV